MDRKLNELREQKRLIDDIKAQHPKAMAWKCSHRFLAGVPDLRIAVPDYPSWWLEVKIGKWPAYGNQMTIGLTELQKHWIRTAQAAGENVGWAVIVERPDHDLAMYVGRYTDDDKVWTSSAHSTIRTRRNGQWKLPFLVRFFEKVDEP